VATVDTQIIYETPKVRESPTVFASLSLSWFLLHTEFSITLELFKQLATFPVSYLTHGSLFGSGRAVTTTAPRRVALPA
jgi:hypothetical protein